MKTDLKPMGVAICSFDLEGHVPKNKTGYVRLHYTPRMALWPAKYQIKRGKFDEFLLTFSNFLFYIYLLIFDEAFFLKKKIGLLFQY